MASRYDEVMKSKPYPPFNMGGTLTEAMVAKARKELGETEEVKTRTIPKLRQLVQAERGLVCPTDDAYLLLFLRARKFDVRKAFSLVKNHFLLKKEYAHIYGFFDLKAIKKSIRQKVGYLLPYRDEEGCVIWVITIRNWDVDETPVPVAITSATAVAVMCLQDPATQICGLRLLVDVRGTTLKQIGSLVPRYAILFAKALKNSFPIRLKGFHVYNESPIFQYMLPILKFFLTEKIKSRLHLHGNSQEQLHKYFPKAILPTEIFGGDNPDDITDWFIPEIEKYLETYREFITYGYRE